MRRGTLDLVGVGRTHIANNDFVNKVRERRFAELELFNKPTHLWKPWRPWSPVSSRNPARMPS